MAQLLLGAIADDFTGATDLANMLVRGGMRTIQWSPGRMLFISSAQPGVRSAIGKRSGACVS